MKKLLKMLSLALLTITISSCASRLPADFPKAPAVVLCAPVFKEKILTHWTCERSDTREKFKAGPKYVQIGIPIETWNQGQTYRRTVEEWIINRCPTQAPK